ncbi:MAG: PAS domain-containing sensor histidine kinase [Spirochaetales bacterium]|nr:PAS domain-containing sensor histidine kinase [Spirochaetales bacterium]MCF7937268.1 PAS domain-containing sensor histidine kinase [Spirochaetales bacterium]
MSIVRDFTERSPIEKELKETHDRLHTILEGLDVGVFVISSSSREILYANSYLRQLIDTEPIGKKCTEVFGYRKELCDECIFFTNSDENGGNGKESFTMEYRLPNIDKWFWINIRPISWKENSTASLAILTDITPIKESELLKEEIDRITRHDLRSPLNGIIGAAQLLTMDEDLSEEQKAYVKVIEESGKRMITKIDQSRTLHKLEKGIYQVTPEQINPFRLIQMVRREFEDEIRQKELDFELHGLPSDDTKNTTLMIRGEYQLLYSIFSELTKNAVEASKQGDTIRLSVHHPEDSGKVNVSIWNNQAIPEEKRSGFGKKDMTLQHTEGAGLGVYTARLMTEALAGSFDWVSSKKDGTKIILEFPSV